MGERTEAGIAVAEHPAGEARPSRHRRYPCAHRAQSSRSRRSGRPPPVSARQHPAQVDEVLVRRRAFFQLGRLPLGDERARRHCGTRVNARRQRQRRAFGWRDNAHRRTSEGGAHGARTSTPAGCSAQIENPRIYCEIFYTPTGLTWAVLSPTNRRISNRFWFFARIARCIAVIGGTGGFLHGRGWGRVPVCVHAVWRGGLPHAAVTSGWRLASSPNSAVLVRRGQRRLLGSLVIYSVLTPCVRQGFCWL